MSRFRRALYALLFPILAAAPAAADPDCGVGLYFDEAGTLRGIDVAPGGEAHAYLIVVFPDDPVPLVEFSQMYTFVHGAPGGRVEIRGGGVNDHVPYDATDLSVNAVWDPPYPVSGPTILADLYIDVDSADPVTIFTLCDFWGRIAGETLPFGGLHCTYCDEMPPQQTRAATINSEWIPIGDEASTWSAVKAMYR